MCVRLLFPIYLALLLAVGRGAEPGEALARFSSQALREHDARMEALRAELAGLPPAPEDQSSERVGWHSEYGFGKKAANTARARRRPLQRPAGSRDSGNPRPCGPPAGSARKK